MRGIDHKRGDVVTYDIGFCIWREFPSVCIYLSSTFRFRRELGLLLLLITLYYLSQILNFLSEVGIFLF